MSSHKHDLKRVLTKPDNRMDNIEQAVGDMRPGEMIQVEVPNEQFVAELRDYLGFRYQAVEFMLESFTNDDRLWVYIYVELNQED